MLLACGLVGYLTNNSMVLKTLFFDTNAVMHYEFIDTIDWPAITGAQSITIIVHSELMRELNEIKDSTVHPRKTKDRAGKIIRHFGELFKDSLTATGLTNVDIHFEADEPSAEIFSVHRLSPHFADDCHLASVIQYKMDHPAKDVVLVTHDTGVQLKARAKGVAFIDAPDQHRLPEEVDPLYKLNQELQKELETYKSRIPDIRVSFDNDTNHIEIVKSIPKDREEKLLTEEKATLAHRIIRLDLRAKNSGKLPASDVDVILTLPNGLRALSEEDVRNLWEMPEEAGFEEFIKAIFDKRFGQPKGTVQQHMVQVAIDELNYGTFQNKIAIPRSKTTGLVSRAIVPLVEKHQVTFHIQKLKQNFPCLLGSFFVMHDSNIELRPFNLNFTINAHELPTNRTGKLNVILRKSETP
jgi:PIN domain